ncbi:MAG: TetR/AcrR family transcriptional regulator [Pseudomonadota bacterium]
MKQISQDRDLQRERSFSYKSLMARPRTYDPDEALDRAMRLFWRRGFAAASYDDLTRATGVSRKGLYTSFGDKRALFVKSLQRYRKTQAISFLAELDEPNAGVAHISEMFWRIANVAKSPAGRNGCFMANTANDETANDPDVQKQILLHLQKTSDRFRQALLRSAIPGSNVDSLADYLTGLLQGLFVLAHGGADAKMIDAYVREGLRVLKS